jgi:hypothetical protein
MEDAGIALQDGLWLAVAHTGYDSLETISLKNRFSETVNLRNRLIVREFCVYLESVINFPLYSIFRLNVQTL